jgi:hypothetical protein
MRFGRHEVWSVAAAVGLHVAVLGALRMTLGDLVPPARSVPARPPELSFDIDIGGDSDAAMRSVSREGTEAVPSRVARIEVRPEEGASYGVEPNAAPAEPAEGARAELDVRPENGEAKKPIDLGIGPDAWQRWVRLRTPEEPRTERRASQANRFQLFRAPPASTTGGLQEGLEEQDRKLGLGPEGRVISAFHNAAHSWDAPHLGTARFDVTVHRTGAVEVTLGSASGEVEMWRKVAAHAAKDLRAAPPRIAPPRDGLRLVVELVAEETMPNGTRKKSATPPRLELAPPKLENAERAKERLAEDNPTMKDPSNDYAPIKRDLPGLYVAESGSVCSYRIGGGVVGHGPRLPLTLGPIVQGGCEPSNIGVKPQRMVRARVLEQSMF